MNKQELHSEMQKAGLERVADSAGKLALESIRLTSIPIKGATVPLGASRLGGQPDLPAGTPWPTWHDVPMAFVAQILLQDAKPFDPTGLLPDAGLLSFFYDAKQETYGADRNDRGGWKVFYFKGDSAGFTRAAYPSDLPREARFHPCALAFSGELTLPFAPRLVEPGLDWSDEEVSKYEDFRSTFPSQDDYRQPHDRMFGYPEQIQDDMQLQSAMMTSRVTSIDDPKAKALEKSKGEWLLLLQIDSDPNAGMRWASTGMLYYWIERQALRDGKFDQTWLILQSE
jgi:uncharacterized protein YwqG